MPLLMSSVKGFGFVCKLADMIGRTRAGKSFFTLEDGDRPLRPSPVDLATHTHIASLSGHGRLLLFAANEIKMLASGGRGVTLQQLEPNEQLLAAIAVGSRGLIASGTGRGAKEATLLLSGAALLAHLSKRARKGKKIAAKFTPERLLAVGEGSAPK